MIFLFAIVFLKHCGGSDAEQSEAKISFCINGSAECVMLVGDAIERGKFWEYLEFNWKFSEWGCVFEENWFKKFFDDVPFFYGSAENKRMFHFPKCSWIF